MTGFVWFGSGECARLPLEEIKKITSSVYDCTVEDVE